MSLAATEVMSGLRGIVFDKDGTLLDLDARWVPVFNTLIERLAERCDDPSLVGGLAALLGIDSERLIPDGPAAVDTAEQIISRVIGELVDRDYARQAAEQAVMSVVGEALEVFGPVKAIGDVVETLVALRASGLRIGVATSDDRANTIHELTHLGVIDLVDAMRCADDDGPIKPDPGVLTSIAAEWGCEPGDLVFVGDSRNDMETARAAGCSFVARSDSERASSWMAEADAVVASIGELAVR